jgi:glycosyltransferase involved in cell wall biosynthesis
MLPTISLVTPSYNSAHWIEATLQSVLEQHYPSLQYVVMDGGSTDGSADIIARYADRLTHWESAPDNGHYDAVVRGFAHTDGEIMGWLNADDLHTPWTLAVVGQIFAGFPDVDWITSAYPLIWDTGGHAVNADHHIAFSRQNHLRGGYVRHDASATSLWVIQQESTFWRRSLWEQSGGLQPEAYPLAGDFDLWTRFFQHAELAAVQTPLAGFRHHDTGQRSDAARAYMEESYRSIVTAGGHRPSKLEQAVLFTLGRRVPRPVNGWLRLAYPAPILRYDMATRAWVKGMKLA